MRVLFSSSTAKLRALTTTKINAKKSNQRKDSEVQDLKNNKPT